MKRCGETLIITMLVISIFYIAPGDLNQGEASMDVLNANDVDWWPTFQHDPGHTGFSTSHGPETNHVLWKIERPFGFEEKGVAVVDGKVYSGDGCEMYCLDAETGEEIWNYTTGWWGLSHPTVYGKMVYFTSLDHHLYCLDAETGKKIWSHRIGLDGQAVTPLVFNDRVYVFGELYQDKFYCFNASSGEEFWNITMDSAGYTAWNSWNNKIYVVSGRKYDQNVFCLDPETGGEVWSIHVDGGVHAEPTVYNEKLYVCTDDKVYCLDANRGSEIWNRTIEATSFFISSSPAICEGRLYVGDDNMYCLDANTGNMIWVYNTSHRIASDCSPAVCDGKVYFSVDGEGLYCLDMYEGKPIWNYSGEWGIRGSPVVADGKLYVAGGWFYCFADPFLMIGEIRGGFGRVYVELTNPGDNPAENISWNITVKGGGGTWGSIDVETTGNLSSLNPGETIVVSTDTFVFGLGKIVVNVTAVAGNVERVDKQLSGFVLGPFVFLQQRHQGG